MTRISKKEPGALLADKKKAFQNMLEMREQSMYPKDFDYKKVMEGNVKGFRFAKTSFVTPDVFVGIIADN